MIKAVLLDFGGVVFSNKDDYDGPKGSLASDPEHWHQARLGLLDDDKVFAEIGKGYGVDGKTVFGWLLSRRVPNQDLLQLISKLKPGIKTAIINNGLKTLFHGLLDKYDLKDRFDLLVNSAEEGVEKPDPEIFLRTCQRLQVQPEQCVMIDDDEKLLVGAKELGMRTILANNSADLFQEFKSLGLLR